jgi:hypothetical protein
MNMHERFAPFEEVTYSTTAPLRSSWLGLLGVRLRAWMKNCADNYAAATAYDDLWRLSDAGLKHRELSRDILARDLSKLRDRACSD